MGNTEKKEAPNSASESDQVELESWPRWCAATLGLILIGIAFFILYNPPDKFESEHTGNGSLARSTNSSIDVSTPFIAVFTAGFAVFLFALNGLRFTKVSAPGLTAEMVNPQKKAFEHFKLPADDRPESEVVLDKMSPEPTEVPSSYLNAADGQYAVYKLTELPIAVITDALTSWPGNAAKPEDLSGFEFATRKTGKGNHPWMLKFKGARAIVVSYGGKSKTGSTVISKALPETKVGSEIDHQ